MWSMWAIISEEGWFDEYAGSFNDRVPITDSNDERIDLYRQGRFGTCMFIISILFFKLSADLVFPILEMKGFSQAEKLKRH